MSRITAERSHPGSRSDGPIFSRHLFAYEQTLPFVTGNVLEVGSGEGYGMRLLAGEATSYTAIDPYTPDLTESPANVSFIEASVPPFPALSSAPFDLVVSHQVIEHIEDDRMFLEEISALLKPGGILVLSTPNRPMSLTRNPWHVREYSATELSQLVGACFPSVSMMGIFGKAKALEYYDRNRAAVEKWKRLDVFDLETKLPRRLLQFPYDVLNRINRLGLQRSALSNADPVSSSDFYLDDADSGCFDLFCIARLSKTE